MILSNMEILAAIGAGRLVITPHPPYDISKKPYSTTAIDFHLDEKLQIPNEFAASIDLTSEESISELIRANSRTIILTNEQPYRLKPKQFVLAQTIEHIELPSDVKPCLNARVEGKSSVARCGLMVHFTAPTIHNAFSGRITLEIINHGRNDFLLSKGMAICQMIFEEIKGTVVPTGGQFIGQHTPDGLIEETISDQDSMAIASQKRPKKKG